MSDIKVRHTNMESQPNQCNDLAMEIKLLANLLEKRVWSEGCNDPRLIKELLFAKSAVQGVLTQLDLFKMRMKEADGRSIK